MWRSPTVWAGFAAVAAARLLTLPKSLWEFDEVLFVRGVERFAPLEHRPHPPGYPLTVGFGKLLAPVFGVPFHALVAASVIASLVAYLALVDAFARIAAADRDRPREAIGVGVAGALLFCLSPPMLLYGPLALSDAPALAFVALMLAAAARLRDGVALAAAVGLADDGPHESAAELPQHSLRAALALGAFAAAAVGCRPQLVVAVVPAAIVGLWLAKGTIGRTRLALTAAAAFGVVCVAWLVPLVVACGGIAGLASLLGKQAGLVAAIDADSARGVIALPALFNRFVAHPWGPKQLSLPMLLAATGGFIIALRRRLVGALPLVVLAAANLALALVAMDPADAVRYALPSLLAVAFFAAVGLDALAGAIGLVPLRWVAAGALCAGFVVFTWPILRARATSDSPPVRAAVWARGHLPPNARLLVTPPLLPHASELLGGRAFTLAEAGPSPPGVEETGPTFLLGEGDTGWPGAVTFRWPPSEAWGKLTRGYYRVVSWSPVPDCGLTPLSGVYGWEPGWRWLDRAVSMRVATRGRRELDLVLGLPPTSPYADVGVTLQAAGADETTVRVRRASRRKVRVMLPATEVAELSLHTDRSFVPSEAGIATDRRRLAVQLVGCDAAGGR
ncbi:MAG TPA: hypothetical protein VN811_16595 [Thermoanaerobaculia bacterium]|nr:hypothetical protein [Thermoanaerobaculia bacterium]